MPRTSQAVMFAFQRPGQLSRGSCTAIDDAVAVLFYILVYGRDDTLPYAHTAIAISHADFLFNAIDPVAIAVYRDALLPPRATTYFVRSKSFYMDERIARASLCQFVETVFTNDGYWNRGELTRKITADCASNLRRCECTRRQLVRTANLADYARKHPTSADWLYYHDAHVADAVGI